MSEETEGQTVGTRIVLQLSHYSRWKGNMVCPRETTQKGIAEKLDLTRAHVAVELGRSRERGWIEEGKAYINGAKRMAKVYFLTHLGERLATQLREMMGG